MQALYSDRFFQAQTFADVSELVGPVPDGYIWVLRDVDVVFPDVLEVQTFTVALATNPSDPAGPIISIWTVSALPSAQGWQGFRGRVVLFSGEALQFTCSGADGVDFQASGYVLTKP